MALFAQPPDKFVNLVLGSYIDASCHIIEQEDARFSEKPAADEYFLLVPSAECANRLIIAWGKNAKAVDHSTDEAFLFKTEEENIAWYPAEQWKGQVLPA